MTSARRNFVESASVEFEPENGLSVGIEGVDQDNLPDSFSVEEMWDLAKKGASTEEMVTHARVRMWTQTSRKEQFWSEWYG